MKIKNRFKFLISLLLVTAVTLGFLNVSNTEAAVFSATGGTISTSGDYTIHTFTGNGTFTPNGSGNVEVLVVGGGGGTGSVYQGGGGGGGGVVYNSSYSVTTSPITVTVGNGGNGSAIGAETQTSGVDSIFGNMTAYGGGRGGSETVARLNGGSGGGSSHAADQTASSATQGTNGTARYGSAGGTTTGAASPFSSPGGGGAGAASLAVDESAASPGAGGIGVAFGISGSTVYYGGGGAGSNRSTTTASGGLGGGGATGTAGTQNTGGGGGAGSHVSTPTQIGGAGGSGIVIIRYATARAAAPQFSTTGGTTTTSGVYTIKTFTGSGTFTPSMSGAVEVLVVGGGGGGGMDMGGGGGGGGVISNSSYTVTANQAITVTVGGGGAGAPAAGTAGQPAAHQYTIPAVNGQNSVFGTLTAYGGGFGGSSYRGYTPGIGGANGGSGGGSSGYNDNAGTFYGGAGTLGQGNRGGNSTAAYYSGGGGGAGGQGADSTAQPNGGVGYLSAINGISLYWGGGGGGASHSLGNGGNGGGGGGGGGGVWSGTGGSGGTGGLNAGLPGGNGVGTYVYTSIGGNAGANTGSGGGGGAHYYNKGGNGGSGIVIVRYTANANCAGVSANGNYSLTSACVFPGTINGVDAGSGTTNTAKLTLGTNSSLTVLSDQTINVGSLELSGGTMTIVDGGTIKIGTPLYSPDADGDGKPTAATTTQYASAGAGRARRSAATDCNDANASVWQYLTGYVDADGDAYSVANSSQVCGGASLPAGYLASASSPVDANDSQACASGANPAGSCNKCVSGAIANQTSAQDDFAECAASYNACSGNTPIGPNGLCNGAAACDTNSQSGSACTTAGACQAGGGCSAGSCVSVYADNNSSPTYPINTYYDVGQICTGNACQQGRRWYSANSCTAGTPLAWAETSGNTSCSPTYTEGQLKTGATCNGACNQSTTYYHQGCDPNNTYVVNALNNGCSPSHSANQLRTDWYCADGTTKRRLYYSAAECVDNYYVSDSACGGDYWGEYRCSGSMSQRAYHSRGCSGGGCYDNITSWADWTQCGGDYWDNSYRCSGNQPQRLYQSRGCAGAGVCYGPNASYWQWGSACATAGTCQSGGGCVGAGSCVAVVNLTTTWSTGPGCGGNQRCYQGVCHSCDTVVWDDNSPNPPIAGQGGNVCWRMGPYQGSCDTACANYGGCVAANWNDSGYCDVCKWFSGSNRQCVYGYDSLSPSLNYDTGYCKQRSGVQTCSAWNYYEQRFCVCQW